jgi:hypothetical protein
MPTVPVKGLDRIVWYEAHVPVWVTNVTAIGLISSETTDLTTKTTNARTAYAEQIAAQETAKAKTQAYYEALNLLSVAGAAAIKKIRGKAEQVGGTSVYTLAEIPPPAIPGPCGELGTPYKFKAELSVTGQLTLGWKNTNPKSATGVVYQVFRRTDPMGAFEYLGGSGDKKFVDGTLPAGSNQVSYQVQAVRSTSVGAFAQFDVKFGVGGTTSVTEPKDTPKLAA